MRILSVVRPTTHQLQVLAKIVAAPTPAVAASEISKDANTVAARNMLMKLNLITYTTDQAQLTDLGIRMATEEDIVDQTGQLTPRGEQLAYNSKEQQPAPTAESVSLLKQLLS